MPPIGTACVKVWQMNYKVIFWDLDDTLLDFGYSQSAALKRCFSELGLGECTDEMVEQYSNINMRYWEALENNEMTKPQILVGRFASFLKAIGKDISLAPQVNETYENRLGESFRFCPHAREVVNHFRGNVLQCMVSNGLKKVQDKKLAASGLGTQLDHIFISEEIGVEKPNLGFYEKVFELLGVRDDEDKAERGADAASASEIAGNIRKSDILVVGDSLTSDIRGGKNAGLKTCWYNPTHKENTRGITADLEIADLRELYDIVG